MPSWVLMERRRFLINILPAQVFCFFPAVRWTYLKFSLPPATNSLSTYPLFNTLSICQGEKEKSKCKWFLLLHMGLFMRCTNTAGADRFMSEMFFMPRTPSNTSCTLLGTQIDLIKSGLYEIWYWHPKSTNNRKLSNRASQHLQATLSDRDLLLCMCWGVL